MDCPEQKAAGGGGASLGTASGDVVTAIGPESRLRVASAQDLANARPQRVRSQSVSQHRSESTRFAEIAQQAADGHPLPLRVPKRELSSGFTHTGHHVEVVDEMEDKGDDGDEGEQIAQVVARSLDEMEAGMPRQSHMVSVSFEEGAKFKPFLIVNVRGGAPNGLDMLCKIDTGSNSAFIRRTYAEKMGIEIAEGPPCECKGMFGDLRTKLFAAVDVALTPDAPKRRFDVVVINDPEQCTSIQEYLLLPAASLKGYHLDWVDRPLLWWGGTTRETIADGTELHRDECDGSDGVIADRCVISHSAHVETCQSEVFVSEDRKQKRAVEEEEERRASVTPANATEVDVETDNPPPLLLLKKSEKAGVKTDLFNRDQKPLEWNVVDGEIRWVRLEGEELVKVKEIFRHHLDAFGKAGPVPSKLRMLHTKLKKDAKEVRAMPRTLTPEKHEYLHRWMQALVDAGMYRQLFNNAWSSPMSLVSKANGEYRPVGDYRAVNEQCEVDAGPMANVRQKMSMFNGCRYFAVFDMENGYLQGLIDDLGTQVYAVALREGVFGPLRVPYGITNACRWFQNAVADMVKDIARCESVFDDIALGGKTFEEFCKTLELFLDRIVEFKVKLKPSKAVVGADKLR